MTEQIFDRKTTLKFTAVSLSNLEMSILLSVGAQNPLPMGASKPAT
jgi:hypothetical protein